MEKSHSHWTNFRGAGHRTSTSNPYSSLAYHIRARDLLWTAVLRIGDTVRLISSDRPPSLCLSSSSLRFSCACPLGPASWPCGRSWSASDPSDRKSTRLNSSHLGNSYAVFCLKK